MLPNSVSIIIVTYNVQQTLEESIKSVINQQYDAIELIVIDGKSTDNTTAIITKYNEHISYWISEPDKGIYDAMNKGIAAAKGKWLLFLGADDILCEGVINILFKETAYPNIDLIYGSVKLSKTFKSFGGETNYEAMIVNNIPHQGIFYNKALLVQLNGYDTRYKILADYALNLKIFETPTIQKQFINRDIAVYNTNGVSNRTIDDAFFSDNLNYFITKKGLAVNDKRLAKYYFFTGVSLILKKDYTKGIKNVLHPIWYGQQRFYYFLLFCQFLLSYLSFEKKYKYV